MSKEKIRFDDNGGIILPKSVAIEMGMRTKKLEGMTEFPTHVFPKPISRFIKSYAKSTGCHEGLVGGSIIGAASIMFGSKFNINPSWAQQMNTFIAIVSEPGTNKSGSMKAGLTPVEKLQDIKMAEYYREKAEYDEALRQANLIKDKAERSEALAALEEPIEPALAYIDTCTVPGLQGQLGRLQERGEHLHLSVVNDEINAVFSSWGAGSASGDKGAEQSFFLTMFSGGNVNKALKEETVRMKGATVSMLGGIQPKIFEEKMAEDGSGFQDRWNIVYCVEELRKTNIFHYLEPGTEEEYAQYMIDMKGKEHKNYYLYDPISASDGRCADIETALYAQAFHDFTMGKYKKYKDNSVKKWEQNYYKFIHMLTVLYGLDYPTKDIIFKAQELSAYFVFNYISARITKKDDDDDRHKSKVIEILSREETRIRYHGGMTASQFSNYHRGFREHSELRDRILKEMVKSGAIVCSGKRYNLP